jgi:hypothetical protein
MVAVKVAAFYRFRPAAARNASAWATRGPSVGEPLAETGAATPAARNGPCVEHGRWAILGAPATRLSATILATAGEHTATSSE